MVGFFFLSWATLSEVLRPICHIEATDPFNTSLRFDMQSCLFLLPLFFRSYIAGKGDDFHSK